MYTENKLINETKKAEREAAELPPSRSDRWQAIFFIKKIALSDSDYGLPRRTAGLLPGVQPTFYVTYYFLDNIVFGAVALCIYRRSDLIALYE